MENISKRAKYEATAKYCTKENCPFCDEKLYEDHQILLETTYWIIFYAKYPYFDEEGVNLLVLPKKHSKFTSDISPKEFADFPKVEKFIQDFYEEK